MFITFYGINNIGKSTQAKRVIEKLRETGKKVEFLKYPIYDIDPSGPFINKILRSGEAQKISEEELQMWFVLNRYQFQPKLKKLLDTDTIVIAEDYRYSGIAWGTTKGADPDWLEEINSKLIPEDLVILLDGQRQFSAKEDGHLHESKDDLVEKCRKFYLELAKKHDWEVVTIEQNPDATAAKIWNIIKRVVTKCSF